MRNRNRSRFFVRGMKVKEEGTNATRPLQTSSLRVGCTLLNQFMKVNGKGPIIAFRRVTEDDGWML
jgi:hypothetical protein